VEAENAKMSEMPGIFDIIWNFLYYTWFIWVLLILGPFAADALMAWRQKHFEHALKWSMLEILIPREIITSPKAMEQIFLQLHSYKNYPSYFKDKYWTGEITLWHSFEIVGEGGEVHFYVRVPRQYRDLVEAAFFAYYPDIEIIEVEDYMKRFPSNVTKLYEENYRMWGTELALEKSSIFPLRDYTHFESPDENKQYDPMSGFIETLSKLKPGALCAIQILVWPTNFKDDPHDVHTFHEYEEELGKIRESKEFKKHAPAKIKFDGILPVMDTGHKEDEKGPKPKLTPGELDTLKAVEENMARPMFATIVRYVYAAPIDQFDENYARRAVVGAFNQYRAVNMNSLTHNVDVMVKGNIRDWPHFYPEVRKQLRAERVWHDFRHREIPPHSYIGKLLSSDIPMNMNTGSKVIHLNTRSLATMWHPPTHAILTGPHIRRIQSKKAGPPAGIDIFGTDEDIERFL
jgi:hypothetical protein